MERGRGRAHAAAGEAEGSCAMSSRPFRRSERAVGAMTYDQWYERIGRPNRLPYMPRAAARASAKAARVRARRGPIAAYALGDIQCGDKTTPPTQDAVFSPSVEAWRDLVSSYAGAIPVNFLMAWIQIESCGNPCSYTSYAEAGIFQLMNGDNINVAGTTLAAIHPYPPCVPGSQTTAYYSSLTDDQRVEQVSSGLRYVNYARDYAHAKLAAAGQDWSEDMPDFWMMVKQVHAAPAYIATGLANATAALGHPPGNWSEFLVGLPGYNLSNAQWTGSFGIGGGGGGFTTIAILVGLAYIAYKLT
jgi:hypothetical protein